MSVENVTRDITPECQVVHFAWDAEGNLENSSLSQIAKATPHDLSRYISQVSFQKRMAGASGEFEIILQNDRDWKEAIKKGTWVIIYMSQDGGLSIPTGRPENKKLPSGSIGGDNVEIARLRSQRNKTRMIGYIDTVRARGTTGAEGELDIEYVISGRDFGVVYEETEIWHNEILFDKNLLLSSANFLSSRRIQSVDQLIETLHKMFFSPNDLVNEPLKDDSLTSLALQWLMPTSLFAAMGISLSGGKKSYFGNIPNVLNLRPTKATFPVENPLSLLNGIAWDRLKTHSLDPYHELFAELDDNGLPRLNFRPMPWKLNRSNPKFQNINSTIDQFADPKNGLIDIQTVNILDWDLGEDNHTRFNVFLTDIITSGVTTVTSRELIGDVSPKTGFPRVLQNGVRRHGLRLYYRTLNSFIDLGSGSAADKTEKPDSKLLKDFNEFSLELWGRSHEYESGTMSIIGNNEVRIGKCIRTQRGAPYNSKKLFYIEGYEDTFTVEDTGVGSWSQTLFLTRGIEESALSNTNRVESRQEPFDNDGEFTEK